MVRSTNSSSSPMNLYGSSVQPGSNIRGPYFNSYYGNYFNTGTAGHQATSITTLNQVVGLVPVFNCEDPECRNGKYGSNDTEFMLPVFAERQLSIWGNYKNDFNTFLFDIPSNSALTGSDFFLDHKVNGEWVELAELDSDSEGTYYPVGKLCDKNYFTGYNIMWNKVLYLYGEGVYRFRIGLSTGTFTVSTNHFDIVGLKPNATVELISVGYGLICPTFTIDDALSFTDNMINLAAFINNYQTITYPTPLFSAVYNAGTGMIDLFGLLGQNCPCSALVTNVTYNNYADTFVDGEDTYEELACYASPPFCLKTWDCWAVDGTSKFDATFTGGVIGNVNKAFPGTTWSFCCSGKPVVYPDRKSLFTIRFWAQGVIYVSTEFTFTPDLGYDLVPPVTFAPGTTYIQCAQQLATAINAYQAGLSPPQFSAYYDPIFKHCAITNLFGQNIQIQIDFTDFGAGNTIQLTLNGFVTVLPQTGTPPNITKHELGKFTGGTNVGIVGTPIPTIKWRDSIRVGGEFGYEDTEYERKSIKYQTGVVNKLRDELLLKHTWKSSSLPFWFHERFKSYGLVADTLLVSDYNLNNSDYNIKQYSVQGDSSYSPDYKNYRRETPVRCEFRPATQNIKRQRCC